MRYGKRYGRLMDILEKLGVAGMALGIFQGKSLGIWLGMIFILISIFGTKEN